MFLLGKKVIVNTIRYSFTGVAMSFNFGPPKYETVIVEDTECFETVDEDGVHRKYRLEDLQSMKIELYHPTTIELFKRQDEYVAKQRGG